jgi:hypothetical protein
MTTAVSTQNTLLLNNLMKFYKQDKNLDKMLAIINGESNISLRIVDWFATNYAKQYFTAIPTPDTSSSRFKVFVDYKLRLRAYSKKRFDPFCRWERISIPYNNNQYVQTTIGQLNFFKWALENKVIDYIENNYVEIENDMNKRNSTSKRKNNHSTSNQKTRKKREELSVLASKSIYKEDVNIIVKFD